MRARRHAPVAALAALTIAVSACELDEVTVPSSRDELVVDAILRAHDPVQRLLLHRTLDGPTIRGEPNAQVHVSSADGQVFRFEERPLLDCIAADAIPDHAQASCYVSTADGAGWVQPGETYELEILSTRDEHLRARTTVPGDFQLHGFTDATPTDRPRCTLPPQRSMPVEWSEVSGAAAYMSQIVIHGLPAALEATGIPDIPEPLRLTGVSVRASHTRFELPGSYGVSERFDLDQDLMRALRAGFPADVRIDLVVAAVDRNTLNANRMDPQGFDDDSRVGGVIGDGTGLFGSLVPRHLEIYITDNETEHSCP